VSLKRMPQSQAGRASQRIGKSGLSKKPVDEKRNARHNLVSVLQMQRRESGGVLRVGILRWVANVL
jgi:hypothetical protein